VPKKLTRLFIFVTVDNFNAKIKIRVMVPLKGNRRGGVTRFFSGSYRKRHLSGLYLNGNMIYKRRKTIFGFDSFECFYCGEVFKRRRLLEGHYDDQETFCYSLAIKLSTPPPSSVNPKIS